MIFSALRNFNEINLRSCITRVTFDLSKRNNMKTTILISGTEEQQNKSYDKIMDREISQRTITRFYTDKEYQTKDGYVVTADFCPYTISLIEKMKNVTIIE